MPSWSELKVFLWGAVWVVLLSLGPVLWVIWSWVTDPYDQTISWHQLAGLAGTCTGPALVAYWRKNRALLKLPKEE